MYNNNNQATILYRRIVTAIIRCFLYERSFSLKQLSELLRLTPAQMSRVYHGVCSLSSEKFVFLQQMYIDRYSSYSDEPSVLSVVARIKELVNYYKEESYD